jgi:N4-gp56 family major capsid protein
VATAPFGQHYYEDTFIDSAFPELVHAQFGQEAILAKGSGKTIEWLQIAHWTAATVALTEGTTPDPSDYTTTPLTATVDQYGRTAGITDMVEQTKPHAHRTKLIEYLGKNKGLTYDTIIRNAVVPATTNIWHSTGAGAIAAAAAGFAAPLDAVMVDKVVRILEAADADYWAEMIRPGTGENSFPIPPAYFAIVHPLVAYTVRNFTDFHPVAAYAKVENQMLGEFGSYKGVRFCMTTNAYNLANGYYNVFFGKDAFGIVPLMGMEGNQVYTKNFGEGDDVLRQRWTAGWKGAWTARVLNDAFMVTLTTTVEA